MKRLHIFIFASLVSLLWGNGFSVYAQPLPSQGTWEATTINKTTSPDNKSPIIELSGDVTLTGCITISNGYTLTIQNVSGKPVRLYKKHTGTMFSVSNGGKLIINGETEKEIILDFGANFEWSDY